MNPFLRWTSQESGKQHPTKTH